MDERESRGEAVNALINSAYAGRIDRRTFVRGLVAAGFTAAAARDMGMDYKRAWTLLDSMNQAFTEPVVSAAPGGARGGGATLTAFGEEVREHYRRIQEQSEALAAGDMKALKRRAKPDAGPKV